MQLEGSFTDFFYNLVPGIAWIFIFSYLTGVDFESFFHLSPQNSVILILVVGLLLGFVFQGFTKWVRSHYMNKKIFSQLEKEDPLFKKSEEILRKSGLVNNDTDLMIRFYMMDNYLRGKHQADSMVYFTARLAFWSNIFFGTLMLLLVALWYHNLVAVLIILISIKFSYWLFYEYLKAVYQAVLQTFVTTLTLHS